jgi:hypothetical protein
MEELFWYNLYAHMHHINNSFSKTVLWFCTRRSVVLYYRKNFMFLVQLLCDFATITHFFLQCLRQGLAGLFYPRVHFHFLQCSRCGVFFIQCSKCRVFFLIGDKNRSGIGGRPTLPYFANVTRLARPVYVPGKYLGRTSMEQRMHPC